MGKQNKSALLTIRSGHSITAVHDRELALLHMGSVSGPPSTSAVIHGAMNDDGLLSKAQMAARSVRGSLVQAFPLLQWSAVTSLSTTLRVQQVRDVTAARSFRGFTLDKWLGFLSEAADAGRHLTCGIIDEFVCDLQSALEYGVAGEDWRQWLQKHPSPSE